MAFGFARERGTGRGYVNTANPEFAIGARLSRRQYDRYVAGLGKRQGLPALSEAAQALVRAERELEALRAALGAQAVPDIASVREAEHAAGRARAVFNRRARTTAGQNRFNVAIRAFRDSEAAHGRALTYAQARADPRFREAVDLLKGKRNPFGDPNIAARNKEGRAWALEMLGGARGFREQYEAMYGARPRGRATRGMRIRKRNKG